jgi:hypothetical protein
MPASGSPSHDESQIVAHSTDPRTLDGLIRAASEDLEQYLVEGIPADHSMIGVVKPGLDMESLVTLALLSLPAFPTVFVEPSGRANCPGSVPQTRARAASA